MRIVICNPDGLGDFILREPLFTGLVAAGHELAMYVRRATVEAAAFIAPCATVLPFSIDPYQAPSPVAEEHVHDLARRLRAFAPDMLIIAPFQWTWVEEKLATLLPDVPSVGFSGGMYPMSVSGPAEQSPWTKVITVAEDTHECAKSRTLADAIGVRSDDRAPAFRVGESQLGPARRWLADRGLTPGEYWLGCVG